MPGLTPAGFEIRTFESILGIMEAVETAEISSSLDLQATGLVGVLNGIDAQMAYEAWQVLYALYAGMDPNSAAESQLQSLALITGTVKEGPRKTDVIGAQAGVSAGFSALPGTMFAAVNGNPTALFVNTSEVPLQGAPATVSVDFEAVTAGPTQVLAGTLTVIATPLAGWNTITNPTDGVIGANAQTDAQLRLKRQEELSSPGSSTADAIRADVLKNMQPPTTTTATTSCTVLFNDSDITDANGLPPHSTETIARQVGATSADDELLAKQILATKAAGEGTSGLSSKVVQDSQGNDVVIYFTRPEEIEIWFDMELQVTDEFPLDGIAQVKAALVAFGQAEYPPGSAVIFKHIQCVPFDIAGVYDVNDFFMGLAALPVGTSNIPIGQREIAAFDTSRINVTTVLV